MQTPCARAVGLIEKEQRHRCDSFRRKQHVTIGPALHPLPRGYPVPTAAGLASHGTAHQAGIAFASGTARGRAGAMATEDTSARARPALLVCLRTRPPGHPRPTHWIGDEVPCESLARAPERCSLNGAARREGLAAAPGLLPRSDGAARRVCCLEAVVRGRRSGYRGSVEALPCALAHVRVGAYRTRGNP